MGLSESKLTSRTAEFILKNYNDYLSWWNCDNSNQLGSGVSLIMKKYIAQYVQSVKGFKGQLIPISNEAIQQVAVSYSSGLWQNDGSTHGGIEWRAMVSRLGGPACVPSSAGRPYHQQSHPLKGFILGRISAITQPRSVTLLPYLMPTQPVTGTLSIRPACCVIGQ